MHSAFTSIFISITGLFCLLSVAAERSPAQPSSPYQKGLELLYRGQVDDALETWETSYEESNRVDARIGFEYIRVITDREIPGQFEAATEMYYKALLNGSGSNSRMALRQEIERLKPIIGDGIYRQWIQWWEEENSELKADMRGFWIQLDPTPARIANQRLIEHWQRIATAREMFTRNSSTIYGTDDRALIYIRYGEPDRKQRGILTLQDLNVKPWLERQILPRTEKVGDDQEMSKPRTDGDQDPSGISSLQTEKLEFIIYEYHRYPEYEIWIYDDLSVESDPLPFIFGTNIRNDQFELRASVEDFIPERAYNRETFKERGLADFTRAGITPALMLQMLYYEQLLNIDPFFEQRLNRLRDLVLEQGREAFAGLDLSFKSESVELIRQRITQAPRQQSTIATQVPSVPVHVYQYRFLDRDQQPYLVTFLESEPREAFMLNFIRNRPADVTLSELLKADSVQGLLPEFVLKHNLQSYDENWQIDSRSADEPSFNLQRNIFTPGAMSVFEQPHTHRGQQSASAELINNNSNELPQPLFDTPYPPSTRGVGSIHFRQPEPLETDPDSLQVADLVLGYQMQENGDSMFPFIVANNQTIPWQETLALHFEVYNLKVGDNGFSRFELTYRILPVDENGKVLTDQTEFTLTLNFTSEENRLIENLEIETADLRPNLYELRVQITDVSSGQKKNRTTRFEVLE